MILKPEWLSKINIYRILSFSKVTTGETTNKNLTCGISGNSRAHEILLISRRSTEPLPMPLFCNNSLVLQIHCCNKSESNFKTLKKGSYKKLSPFEMYWCK